MLLHVASGKLYGICGKSLDADALRLVNIASRSPEAGTTGTFIATLPLDRWLAGHFEHRFVGHRSTSLVVSSYYLRLQQALSSLVCRNNGGQ